ncbi:hypothetical protein N7533_010469 [Penicillium manginii]|uniref:uncharacterized protein n=1 Tax=Penicillium manginii TaxID=203109 RepID=UPI0025499BD9|nr:uncharacterized protein N7533_010469 [Penicillium manginii]KAJ5743367.1 hypothetical protein N7533_010469 [Penicillium manginii]
MRMGSSSQETQKNISKLDYGFQTPNVGATQTIETEHYEEMRHGISLSYYDWSINASNCQGQVSLRYPLELLNNFLSIAPSSYMLDVNFDNRFFHGLLDTAGADNVLYDCPSGIAAQATHPPTLGFI